MPTRSWAALMTSRDMSLCALLATTALATFNPAAAQTLSGGAILTVDNGNSPTSRSNTAGTFQNYSVAYTPTQTGNAFLLFAFRQVPAYWTFGNVSVNAATAGVPGTNIVSNGNFATGGAAPSGTGYSQIPSGWGVVLQTGQSTPAANGAFVAPGQGSPTSTSGQGVNTATSGSWRDGSVGSYDGIYQVLSLIAGVNYTISFSALGDNAATSPSIELATYAAACMNGTSTSPCDFSQFGFTSLITPSGFVAPVTGHAIDTSQPFFLASTLGTTTAPAFQGGTLRMDRTNGSYAQNFTLDASTTNTIDQYGNSSTFTGSFTNAAAGTPGNITFANSAAGGSITLSGTNSYTGTTTVNSGATLIVDRGGSITSSSYIYNSGALQINAGGLLMAGGVTNFASGSIVNNGTVFDALNNYGTMTNSGAYTADVINNYAGATFTSTGTVTATSAINNNSGATFNAQGSLTTPTLNNAGLFQVTGPLTSTITTINNSGIISLANGATTDTLATTTLNGTGGTVVLDVNAKTGAADKFAVTTLTGSNQIAVSPVGGATYITTPVLIGTATTTAPGTTVIAAPSPGIINYQVQQTGSNYYLVSTLNTSVASAAPAGIDSIIAALQTGFFQNSSAFISEPPDPKPNQVNGGPWIRLSTGSNDITSTTSAANPTTGTSTAPSKVRSNFSGFQVGGDVGVANVQNSGWNTHLGVTGGMVTIGTNDLLDPTTRARTSVPFVGVYGAITGHNFFADLQFREDFYNLNITNGGAFLTGAPLSGNAYNINGSMGYKFDLGQNWFIEPSGALAYSHLTVKTLTVGLDAMGTTGSLAFNPFNSLLGRLGVRAGTTYVLEKASLALQPFVTGSVWREFAGNTSSTFITSTASVPLSVTRIGTFGQVGLGVSGQVLNTGLLGFLRGDYRFGDHLNGYALVAGMRYQF